MFGKILPASIRERALEGRVKIIKKFINKNKLTIGGQNEYQCVAQNVRMLYILGRVLSNRECPVRE